MKNGFQVSLKPCSYIEVILFLTGNGHVDDRQDFFGGGIDQLMRNNELKSYILLAPKPLSKTGVLRYNVPCQTKLHQAETKMDRFVCACVFRLGCLRDGSVLHQLP